VTEGDEDCGWVLKSDSQWRVEPLTHVKLALKSNGLNDREINEGLGSLVFTPWMLVNRPFQPEYPGDRAWNRDAAQFRFVPKTDRDDLRYPTWLSVLHHIGLGIDEAVRGSKWASANRVLTGADYLKCWIASLFQYPNRPLPYLFLYSPEQNTGKSTLHEGVALLMTRGVERADVALTSTSGFNGELKSAVLCVVEETSLKKGERAYARIKDWVTSRRFPVHEKGVTPYSVPNVTHWIHCSNDRRACPIFPGDTRITMIRVPPLDPGEEIPREVLHQMLEKEAPDFLTAMLALELPPPSDRLGIPIVESVDKLLLQDENRTELEAFIDENCHHVPGSMISQKEFCAKFSESLDPNGAKQWSKTRVGHEMPGKYPKGRAGKDGQNHFGNIAWELPSEGAPKLPRLVVKDGKLVPAGD
jgi:hypothetical protein